MQSYANFMHTVNLHSSRSLLVSEDMTAIRRQLIEIICVLWFGYFWGLTGCCAVTVYFHCTRRLTAIIDPDANQRVIHFKQTTRYLPDLHVVCHLKYSLITSWFVLLYNAQEPFKAMCIPYLHSDLTCRRRRKIWNDSLRAAGKSKVLSVKTCFVCRIFFSLLSLEGRGAVDEFLSRSHW